MSVLDCESIESLEYSLESIFNIPISDIKRFLSDLDITRLESKIILDFNCIETVLLDEMVTKFKIQPSFDTTCWFHLTRTSRPEDFKKGIYPLDDIINTIWNDLYSYLCDDLTEQQWLKFRGAFENGKLRAECQDSYLLYELKMGGVGQGPFAVLIRDVSLIQTGHDNFDYLDVPEIIRDICNCYEKIYNIDLLTKYKHNTKKYAIKFKSDIHDVYHLGFAILYFYKTLHKIDIGPYDNCFFGGNGTKIISENILKIIPQG